MTSGLHVVIYNHVFLLFPWRIKGYANYVLFQTLATLLDKQWNLSVPEITALASNRPTEALASVISFTFVNINTLNT